MIGHRLMKQDHTISLALLRVGFDSYTIHYKLDFADQFL